MKKTGLLIICLVCALRNYAQEVPEQVPIETSAEADSLRARMRAFIWANAESDTATIDDIIQNELPQGPLESLTSLKGTEKIVLRLKNGFTSTVFVLHPKISNHLNIPILYHGGHGGVFWEDQYLNNSGRPYSISVLNFFLSKGFDVVTIDMPLCGENPKPVIAVEDNITHVINTHDDIFQLKNPFYYFFEPVRKTVDYLEQKYEWKRVIMMGLSGGGWTSTLYSAIDRRIGQSFSVAGSVPIPLRTNPSDVGDLEQNYPPFYDQFNYTTIYTLASSGRRKIHYQILNVDDNCCFNINGNEFWVPQVQEKLKELKSPGFFGFYYDPYATLHKISSVAVDTIYKYIKNDFLPYHIPFAVKLGNSGGKNVYCNGETISLSTPLFESDSIKWFKDGVPLKSETTPFIQVSTGGAYYAKVLNISGLEIYSDTVTLEFLHLPQPFITKHTNRLISSVEKGNQWYRNGVPVPNATQNWLDPVLPGAYSVLIAKDGCSSLPSNVIQAGIDVFPNPASREFNITFNAALGTINMLLYDLDGRLLLKDILPGSKKVIIPATVKKGMYILKFINQTGVLETRKLIIE